MFRIAVFLMTVLAGLALVACADQEQPASQPSAALAPEPTAAPEAEASQPSLQTGGLVGNRIPDFDMTLVDGSQVGSASLLTAAQPAYLFFFATW